MLIEKLICVKIDICEDNIDLDGTIPKSRSGGSRGGLGAKCYIIRMYNIYSCMYNLLSYCSYPIMSCHIIIIIIIIMIIDHVISKIIFTSWPADPR